MEKRSLALSLIIIAAALSGCDSKLWKDTKKSAEKTGKEIEKGADRVKDDVVGK